LLDLRLPLFHSKSLWAGVLSASTTDFNTEAGSQSVRQLVCRECRKAVGPGAGTIPEYSIGGRLHNRWMLAEGTENPLH